MHFIRNSQVGITLRLFGGRTRAASKLGIPEVQPLALPSYRLARVSGAQRFFDVALEVARGVPLTVHRGKQVAVLARNGILQPPLVRACAFDEVAIIEDRHGETNGDSLWGQ